ncbi:hypothetical protein E2562_011357 [Oryza meyeriana var. granulata]|uniref:Uncharacterized protein n=1 Tax=Oryza meyeriana var. granulata TaxID=110450 RepID=A0A6G1BW19_9ORYZ|nr:hypothetical protein E2562_011357 [Oryza meyeriana var. granulata]
MPARPARPGPASTPSSCSRHATSPSRPVRRPFVTRVVVLAPLFSHAASFSPKPSPQLMSPLFSAATRSQDTNFASLARRPFCSFVPSPSHCQSAITPSPSSVHRRRQPERQNPALLPPPPKSRSAFRRAAGVRPGQLPRLATGRRLRSPLRTPMKTQSEPPFFPVKWRSKVLSTRPCSCHRRSAWTSFKATAALSRAGPAQHRSPGLLLAGRL